MNPQFWLMGRDFTFTPVRASAPRSLISLCPPFHFHLLCPLRPKPRGYTLLSSTIHWQPVYASLWHGCLPPVSYQRCGTFCLLFPGIRLLSSGTIYSLMVMWGKRHTCLHSPVPPYRLTTVGSAFFSPPWDGYSLVWCKAHTPCSTQVPMRTGV